VCLVLCRPANRTCTLYSGRLALACRLGGRTRRLGRIHRDSMLQHRIGRTLGHVLVKTLLQGAVELTRTTRQALRALLARTARNRLLCAGPGRKSHRCSHSRREKAHHTFYRLYVVLSKEPGTLNSRQWINKGRRLKVSMSQDACLLCWSRKVPPAGCRATFSSAAERRTKEENECVYRMKMSTENE
jgi:hypothetical protein